MERKLSEKATRLRQRFTFSRNAQGRHRASTMTSSAALKAPNNRPRSSTTPVSSNYREIEWDSTDPSHFYRFTDEPGYFRPASPLLNRQTIEEDLEDEVKHACAMLVHSIERGLPTWPSFDTERRPNTGNDSWAKASTSEPETQSQSKFQDQSSHTSPLAMTIGNGIPVCKGTHDSGVAFSAQSSGQFGPAGRNSLSGMATSAGNGRFYGRRVSTSPPEKECYPRGRSRGQSFATDATSLRSRSGSRSRSSSPVLFPYSPPQADALWTHDHNNDFGSPAHVCPEQDSILGAEGMTWLRASFDVHGLCEPESPTSPSHQEHFDLTTVPVPALNLAPRRFYSTRQLPSEKTCRSRERARELRSSRESSIDGGLSVRSLSFDEEKRDGSFPVWAERDLHDSYESDPIHSRAFYSVVISADNIPPGQRQRRNRASQLLRKLTGLGMRRREGEMGERRRIDRAVAVAG